MAEGQATNMKLAIPSLEDIEKLPRLRELTVPEEYEDSHGHMQVTHHLGIHDDSRSQFIRLLGIDETYFSQRRMGVPAVECHLRFLAEVHVGDRVAVHVRFHARSARAMHTLWFLVNLSRQQLANYIELVMVHVDLEQRRPTPFAEDVALALDRMIAEHSALSWPPPLCGSMRVDAGSRGARDVK
jgi:acyl-CoA thioester hydrolase